MNTDIQLTIKLTADKRAEIFNSRKLNRASTRIET